MAHIWVVHFGKPLSPKIPSTLGERRNEWNDSKANFSVSLLFIHPAPLVRNGLSLFKILRLASEVDKSSALYLYREIYSSHQRWKSRKRRRPYEKIRRCSQSWVHCASILSVIRSMPFSGAKADFSLTAYMYPGSLKSDNDCLESPQETYKM